MSPSSSAFTTVWPVVRGCNIHTRISTGEPFAIDLPVVCIHGLGVSARYMLPTAELLAAEHRVIAPDLPGFGASDRPERVLSIPELADYVADWLLVIGVSRAAFLGNSLGCQVIVDLAVRYPQLVVAAILVGPTVDPSDLSMRGQLWRGWRDLLHEPWSLWPLLMYDYFITGTRRMYRTFRYALADHVETKLPAMQAPTLVVRGSRDTIVPQPWAEEVCRLLPRGRLVVLPNATHAANYSASRELTQLVNEFLATCNLADAQHPT